MVNIYLKANAFPVPTATTVSINITNLKIIPVHLAIIINNINVLEVTT
jgi:hypothetical protein